MNKAILLAIGGALAGVAVAFGAFTFLMGDPVPAEAAPETVVEVPGKIGPHITLTDRVFNLLPSAGSSANYLKLQTIVEFETTDQRWAHVLTGCGTSAHGAALGWPRDLVASSAPGGPAVDRAPEVAAPKGDPCEEELEGLMTAFEKRIGNGRALIEDAVTSIVTGHTADEIATPAGKEALKVEIQVAVDELLGEPRVKRVLFINFITQ